MSDIPAELRYIDSHEWVSPPEDGIVSIGITDHAQNALGDVVFVELPTVGADVAAGGEAGVVESVKAASDIYSPVTGTVVEVNAALEDAPELVNSDPYGDGWFFRVRLLDATEFEGLLDADGYAVVCEDES